MNGKLSLGSNILDVSAGGNPCSMVSIPPRQYIGSGRNHTKTAGACCHVAAREIECLIFVLTHVTH